MTKTLSAIRLRELLHYDPATGVFTRRRSTGGKVAGSVCGSPQSKGYVQIMIDKQNHLAHRLAWLYVMGTWPIAHIDHIDGCRTNNAFVNLRDADRKTNAQNTRTAHRDNSSGLLGVSFDSKRKKFSAGIWADGGRKHLGRYETAEAAYAAYLAAKRSLHEGCTL